jgi:hypothetical protein
MAAKSMPNDQENKEIMLRTIAVWAKLPFNYELLKEFELGKVIKSVSKDKNVDDGKDISDILDRLKNICLALDPALILQVLFLGIY